MSASPRSTNVFADSSGWRAHEVRKKAAARAAQIFVDIVRPSESGLRRVEEISGEREAVALGSGHAVGRRRHRHDDAHERGVALAEREAVVDQPGAAPHIAFEHGGAYPINIK